MRARYYSPALRRFINADIIPGEISEAVTLNRYAYANGNPVSNIDPFGLSVDNRTEYDRSAAVSYALQYAKSGNDEYLRFDSLSFKVYYLLAYNTRAGSDCANFVSQCLAAGGIEYTEEWYFYAEENTLATDIVSVGDPTPLFYTYYVDKNGLLTYKPKYYCFSAEWTVVTPQYEYFSDPNNGYTSQDAVIITSPEDIDEAIEKYNIQKGDLLYWSADGGETVHHSTIITSVTDTKIGFSGHSNTADNKNLAEKMSNNGESVVIVLMNDYIN